MASESNIWKDQKKTSCSSYLLLVSLRRLSPRPHRCRPAALQNRPFAHAARSEAEKTFALLLRQGVAEAPRQSPPLGNTQTRGPLRGVSGSGSSTIAAPLVRGDDWHSCSVTPGTVLT